MIYREITAHNIVVSEQDYPRVEALLQDAGYPVIPTKCDNGIFVFPKFDEPKQDIQALKDLAPYIITKGKIIVEVQGAKPPKTWLHLLFDGNGGVQEMETPQWQYNIED